MLLNSDRPIRREMTSFEANGNAKTLVIVLGTYKLSQRIIDSAVTSLTKWYVRNVNKPVSCFMFFPDSFVDIPSMPYRRNTKRKAPISWLPLLKQLQSVHHTIEEHSAAWR